MHSCCEACHAYCYRMTARVEGLLSRFVRLQNPLESRQLGLTQIALTSYIRQSLLPLVKEYWLHYFQTHTCFQDLRRVIGGLSTDEQKDFHSYITQTARSLTPNSEDISKVRQVSRLLLHTYHPCRKQCQHGYMLSTLFYPSNMYCWYQWSNIRIRLSSKTLWRMH